MRTALFLFASLALTGCICGPGSQTCDNSCVDVQSDAENCGACGEACRLGQICVEGACVGGATRACASDEACSDGEFCTGIEHCVQGFCRPSAPVVCDDGIACTTEVCSNEARTCVARPSHSACASGKRCTGTSSTPDGCE